VADNFTGAEIVAKLPLAPPSGGDRPRAARPWCCFANAKNTAYAVVPSSFEFDLVIFFIPAKIFALRNNGLEIMDWAGCFHGAYLFGHADCTPQRFGEPESISVKCG